MPRHPKGRRDRNMAQKRDRILSVAASLFAEHGYDTVTTQEIAAQAGIGAGTLFLYAASKRELLLMVYNGVFRGTIAEGLRRASATTAADPVAAAYAYIAPTIEHAYGAPGNAAAYQRELFFGGPRQEHREEALALVRTLESAITERLMDAAREQGSTVDPAAAALAGRSVFAVMNLAISRLSVVPELSGQEMFAKTAYADPLAQVRGQVAQIIAGYLAGAASPLKKQQPARERKKKRHV